MAKGKLTEKQKRFADYYIELGNAEQAAIKAGYSERYARGNAYKMVANSGVKEYISSRMAQKEKKTIASQDEVLEYLTSVLRGEVTEETPIVLMRDFKVIDKKPAIKDRNKAAELLGKRYQLFTDKVSLDAEQKIIILDDLNEEG